MRLHGFIAFAACFVQTTIAQNGVPRDLDSCVEKTMKTFEVPGVSVAIVKDGKPVLTKGYGVKKLGEPEPVDEMTLFGIASNTKAFTATALGLLVEEGKVEWDAPVVKYLPWFQLSDPYVTREITIRDLLVHRSGLGLGAGDLLWWPTSTYDRKEIAKRLRFIPLKTSFRSAYAYDNVLYLVAGEVIEAVSGLTWEEFVQTRILDKLGMTTSNVHHSDAASGANVATTHARVDGVVRPIAPFTSDVVNPAGGVNSNAHDIARWMICELDSGRMADGSRLYSPRVTRQMWGIVTPFNPGIPAQELAPLRTNFSGYALGLGISEYRGRKMVAHTGGLPGYVSRITLIPELRLGVAVFTNQESGEAFDIITNHILDAYMNVPEYDWLGAFKRLTARRDSIFKSTEQKEVSSRDTTSRPSLPLAKYAGEFTDPWYGSIVVEYADGQLTMKFSHTPSLTGKMEFYQYNTFIARWNDRELRADAYVTYALNPDGTIDQVKMKSVSPETDFSFDFQDLLLKPASKK